MLNFGGFLSSNFWTNYRCTSSASIEDLLNNKECTVDKLLDDDDCLQEFKNYNDKLIKYFDHDKLKVLIDYITVMPDKDDGHNRGRKYPFITGEIFNCEINQILDKFFEAPVKVKEAIPDKDEDKDEDEDNNSPEGQDSDEKRNEDDDPVTDDAQIEAGADGAVDKAEEEDKTDKVETVVAEPSTEATKDGEVEAKKAEDTNAVATDAVAVDPVEAVVKDVVEAAEVAGATSLEEASKEIIKTEEQAAAGDKQETTEKASNDTNPQDKSEEAAIAAVEKAEDATAVAADTIKKAEDKVEEAKAVEDAVVEP